MKKFYSTIITMVTLLGLVSAQSPDSLSFQAVIRGGDGSLVTNQSVSAKITILQGSETGTPVYTETHTATTNENGLLTLFVGGGTSSDDFTAIDWGAGSYFIKREIDPNGGTNYLISGTGQFLSVPYALYAKSATGDNLGDHEATKNIDLNGFTLVDSVASNSDPMKILVENNDADIEIKSYDEIYITTVDGGNGNKDPMGVDYGTQGDIELTSADDIYIKADFDIIIETNDNINDDESHDESDIKIKSYDNIFLDADEDIIIKTNDAINSDESHSNSNIKLDSDDDIFLEADEDINLTAADKITLTSGSGDNLTIESGNDIELIFYDDPLDYVEIWRGRDHFLYTLPNTEGEEGQILIRQGTASGATSERFTQWTPYKLPLSDGTAGQVLTTDGTGNVTWVTNSTTAKTIQRIDIQQKELDEMKEKLQSLNNTVLNQNELIQEMRELIREQAQMLAIQAKVLESIKKNKKG